MKALIQITIIIVLLCTSLASGNSSQTPSTPVESVSIQANEMTAIEAPASPVAVSVWPSEGRAASAVLVIPSTQMKPDDIAAVIEDMSIMSRIVDKNLSQQRLTLTRITGESVFYRSDYRSDASWLPWLSSQPSNTTEAMYLEGFGSLFFLSVDFPLSPPPKAQEEKPEEGVDTVWRDTRIAIYNPETANRRIKAQPQKEYDAEKVEDLQKTIIKTLKHAANIRGLKADEWVTVVVRSSAPSVTITGTIAIRSTSQTSPAGSNVATSRALPATEVPGQATFLTIRAKKSDIDSFAKDQLNYDQFSQRVSVLTY